MSQNEDVIQVAWAAGEALWVHGRGNPALMVAGLVVAGGVLIGYGSYKYGAKFYDSISEEFFK